MRITGSRVGKWLLAMTLFLGVAMGTATVYAMDCFSQCQDCRIWYFDCGACGGDGCNGWGAACGSFCWKCGGDGEYQCQPLR